MTDTLPAPLDVRLMNQIASILLMVCVVLVLAAGAWWALRHPAFSIGRIVVQGDLLHNNAVTLRANVAPQLTGNFFTIDLYAARSAFQQVPWVRSAQVRREYPRTLQIVLQEHQPVAHWVSDSGTSLVNTQGEVFEADSGDDLDDLPRWNGPQGQSALVFKMYGLLKPVLEPLNMVPAELVLSNRGGWRMTTHSGAALELGGGTPEEVLQRTQRFTRTLVQVAAHHGRRIDTLESADLRHTGGYALRLRGVATAAAGAMTAVRK